MRVLVTGATGYVGGRLVPRLLDDGHEVRVTSRDGSPPEAWWSERTEVVPLDVTDADQVDAAVAGRDAVVHLVHGMGGDDFAEADRAAARHIAAAVDRHGVGRIVYLSGIIPPVERSELSEHLASRLEVEEILTASSATTLTLRAAVVMGSGSTSFEIIRQVAERMPVHTVPDWMTSDVQPIAVVDVVEALVGALTAQVASRAYDVGGPDVLPYPDLLDRYCELAGLERPSVEIPLLPTALVGRLVASLTDVPTPTVEALVESLREDMVCGDDDFRADLLPAGYALMGLDEMVERSLAERTADPAKADPMGPMPHDPHWASGGEDRPLAARAVDGVRTVLGLGSES